MDLVLSFILMISSWRFGRLVPQLADSAPAAAAAPRRREDIDKLTGQYFFLITHEPQPISAVDMALAES